MCLHYILVRLLKHCCNENATKCSIVIVSGVNVAVNNTKVFSVATEIQNRVPSCTVVEQQKIFRVAINSNYLKL